jgi:short-subunit dehydrogenase
MSDTMRQARTISDRFGPWAVVTGASSGIGRALANRLAEAGCDVVLAARRGEILEEMATSMRHGYGVRVRAVALDLADGTGLAELEAATADLDVGLLVAAAGLGTSGPLTEVALERELMLVDVNCRALLAHTWHFGRRFVERGRGGVVLLSSIVAFQGNPWAANYAATKAYVQALGEALHVELGQHGVDVLTAAPGPTDSGFAEVADMHLGQTLTPDQVADGILGALGRRSTTLPGSLSKLLRGSLAMLPRRVRTRVMGRVMAGMTTVPVTTA